MASEIPTDAQVHAYLAFLEAAVRSEEFSNMHEVKEVSRDLRAIRQLQMLNHPLSL